MQKHTLMNVITRVYKQVSIDTLLELLIGSVLLVPLWIFYAFVSITKADIN